MELITSNIHNGERCMFECSICACWHGYEAYTCVLQTQKCEYMYKNIEYI